MNTTDCLAAHGLYTSWSNQQIVSTIWEPTVIQGANLRPIFLMVYELINEILRKFFYNYLMIPLGHNFADVMAAQLPWHLQICDLIGPLLSV